MLKITSGNMKTNLYLLIVISMVVLNVSALEISGVSACPTPLIFESINGFKLPVDDIAQLLANQYSHNNLSNINAPNKVYLTNIVYQSRLLSQDQSQSQYFYFLSSSPTPLSANIFNDKIEFEINYKIAITQGLVPKNKTFTAKTKISNIIIIYQKDYVLENSSFVISKVSLKLQTSMFKTTFDQQPNQKQIDSFNAAITGNTSSLFATFVKLLNVDDVARQMQTNIKKQPLSAVYKENPYNYKFENGINPTFTIPVDVTTTWINASSQKQLTNGISGTLEYSYAKCSNFIPDFSQHGGQLFITQQFIQNFVGYTQMVFNGWQQIKIDKTTVRSTLLQWQLLDLDYIVDNLWTDLYMVTQNEIYFTCSAQKNLASKLIDNKGPKLHQTLKWACNGFVKLNQTAQQKVIEFYPTINHITDLQIYQGSIKPYVNVLQFIDWQFKDVPSMNGQTVYKVNQNNMKLAQKSIESVFNDFRTYPVGHRFWVGEKASRIQIEDQAKGIWIL